MGYSKTKKYWTEKLVDKEAPIKKYPFKGCYDLVYVLRNNQRIVGVAAYKYIENGMFCPDVWFHRGEFDSAFINWTLDELKGFKLLFTVENQNSYAHWAWRSLGCKSVKQGEYVVMYSKTL